MTLAKLADTGIIIPYIETVCTMDDVSETIANMITIIRKGK